MASQKMSRASSLCKYARNYRKNIFTTISTRSFTYNSFETIMLMAERWSGNNLQLTVCVKRNVPLMGAFASQSHRRHNPAFGKAAVSKSAVRADAKLRL